MTEERDELRASLTVYEELAKEAERAVERFHRIELFLAENAAKANDAHFDPWAKSAQEGRDSLAHQLAALAQRGTDGS